MVVVSVLSEQADAPVSLSPLFPDRAGVPHGVTDQASSAGPHSSHHPTGNVQHIHVGILKLNESRKFFIILQNIHVAIIFIHVHFNYIQHTCTSIMCIALVSVLSEDTCVH